MTEYLSLKAAADRLGLCTKTLATWLKANPVDPPLYAKPGKAFIISVADVDRIYETMKRATVSEFLRPPTVPNSNARTLARLRELTDPKAQRNRL